MRRMMVQYFEWYLRPEDKLWESLKEDSRHLKSLGVSDVWMPPVYKGKKGINDSGYGVYDLYDMGEFDQWEESKKDENTHLFIRYLTYWVAGTKLIFVVLLLVILFTGSETTKIFGVGAMILSIATYYWKLHPIIKQLDHNTQITPKGYSKTLGYMIASFMSMFIGALLVYVLKVM